MKKFFLILAAMLGSLACRLSAVAAAPTYAAAQPFWAVSGTLNGMALPGFPSLAWFEWGTSTGYGQTTSPVSLDASASVVWVSAGLSNLLAGQVYHARLVVSNATSLAFGADQQFITFDHPIVTSTNRKLAQWLIECAGWAEWPPPQIAPLSDPVAVSAGGSALVLRRDGTVVEATGASSRAPPAFTNVVAIAASKIASIAYSSPNLALHIDGTVVTASGEVIAGLSNVVAIAAGGGHYLALRNNGTVIAWSQNGGGQTNVPPGLSNVVAVAAGGAHSLALRDDGRVLAWGGNDAGQTNVPPDLSNVVAIAAGGVHNLALRNDGTVVSWGGGQSFPTNVPVGLSNVVAVAASSTSSLALRSDGTVVEWDCFGSPEGAYWTSHLSNVVTIAAGPHYNLALGANAAPIVYPSALEGPANNDLLVGLRASDLNNEPLRVRITSLPAAGTLYQVENGGRGVAITAPQTVVTDPARRVIFVPAPGALGDPYAALTFTANDGELDAVPATVTISVIQLFPQISIFSAYGNHFLRFGGLSTNTYRIWVSTNLLDWRVLEVLDHGWQRWPGVFQFFDVLRNDPARFYKVSTP